MSLTMRAAVLHDILDLRVEDFPKPSASGKATGWAVVIDDVLLIC